MKKKPFLRRFLFFVFFLIISRSLFAQSNIFDRTGVIPEHGSYSSLPQESVDLFTGNLTLSYRDIFLPGPNGLNIEVWRIYNSKILKDRQQSQQTPSVQAYPKSMVGIGWTMHMGIVHQYWSSTPIIEFPDGRRETAYFVTSEYNDSGKHITRDFLKYDSAGPAGDPKLYFKNGVIWTFGNSASLPLAIGGSESVLMVTRIEDPYGNYIEIEYDPSDNSRSIETIIDNMGREIRFVKSYQGSDAAKLAEIRIRNYNDSHDVVYSYSVGSFPNGYYKLVSCTPPGLPPTSFEYNDGLSYNYELTRLTTSYGGILEYSYENHYFYFKTTQLDSRVVSQKRITFNPGELAKAWNYVYPTYQGVTSGTASVQGPESSTQVTHYAYDNSNPWRIGLEASRTLGDTIYSSSNIWTYQQISTTNWSVLGTNMGTAKGPLVSSATQSRTGDATLKEQYYYDRAGAKRYGFPTKVGFFVNGSGSAKTSKEFTYYHESHSTFLDKYMLSFIENEKDKSGTGTILKETIMSYFNEAGKWGAVKQMKRWKAGAANPIYYTWDYTYEGSNPVSICISADAPGDGGISSAYFTYGMESSISTPTFEKYTRIISKYSYILNQHNQYGGWMAYTYDDLGRVTSIDRPEAFNDTNYNWRPNNENKVVITQGNNTVTMFWDGMGRETGYTESGDGTTLYYRRTLDAEGRMKDENSGSIDPSHKYNYVLDASGRATQITDPVNKVTTISYSGATRTRTVIDPEDHSTAYEHNDLPGLPTRLTDAQSHVTDYTYDGIGRLKTVYFNAARTQSYDYDGVDNVTAEIHPETGILPITYQYNSANRLSQKTWSGVSHYFGYNTSGQLTSFTGAETVTYEYDDATGRMKNITGSSGWSRNNLEYNVFGSVKHEDISIPGLGSKSIAYEYDGNNNLIRTFYPEGRIAETTYNGLNRPESLTFNQTTLVNSTSYGPDKRLASMSIVGNGTSLTSTFYNNGAPSTVTLVKGASTLYNASYTYDGVGNILGISSTAPSPSLSASFGYDSLNRMTSATYTSGRVGNYAYAYDEYGNMRTVMENGLTVFDKTYDNSNRIDSGYTYDSRGNLTSAQGKNYFWDAQNRLTSIMDISGQFLADYRYDDRGLRISSLPPVPDINVRYYLTGSSIDITASLNIPSNKTFTIDNLGHSNLEISDLTFSGADAALFSVQQQPSSPVSPNQSTTFIIRFLPTSTGNKTALLSIASNDPDENPYTINLNGYCEPEIEGDESYDFGTVTIGESITDTLHIQNIGTATLVLYGWPISIEEPGGTHYFHLEGQTGNSLISPGGSNTFTIRFAPMSEGIKTATISIESNDLDENPYVITLTGVGQTGPMKISEKSSLIIVFPSGGEELEAGSIQNVTWTGGDAAEAVKIEYSVDNGSTYRTIVERAVNIGTYPWKVPQDISQCCLVRISDPDGAPAMPVIISYEFNFRVSVPKGLAKEASHFTFRAGLPDLKTQSYQVAEVTFAPDGLRGCENLLFNYAIAEIQSLEQFFDNWHNARIQYDMINYSGSVWIDSQPVLSNVPLNMDLDVNRSPEISVRSTANIPVKIWIDDIGVKFLDQSLISQDPREVAFRPLFKDNFTKYERALFPERGGWLAGQELDAEGKKDASKEQRQLAQEGSGQFAMDNADKSKGSSVVDEENYVSSSKSFKLESSGAEAISVVKRFSLPVRIPFSISNDIFVITPSASEARGEKALIEISDRDRAQEREYKKQKRANDIVAGPERGLFHERRHPGSEKAASSSIRSVAVGEKKSPRMLSGSPVDGKFYIYAFDGRLLAEYNVNQQCVREYIYIGGQLIAEYRTLELQYYYYNSDQISSTRIVTNGSGTVVYSAAHDPYGGIQKTWPPSTYDPSLKFSGKEQDGESELDYFGKRYYDKKQYRFISIDPIFSGNSACFDPQLLNLYSYSRDNPISYLDPDGAYPVLITIVRTGITPSGGIKGTFTVETPIGSLSGYTLERSYLGETLAMTKNSESAIRTGNYTGTLLYDAVGASGQIWDTIELFNKNLLGDRTGIWIHNGTVIGNSKGCILVGFGQNSVTGNLSSGAQQAMFDLIEGANVTAMANPIREVLMGFSLLLSIADFPEITVKISWDPTFLQKIAQAVCLTLAAFAM